MRNSDIIKGKNICSSAELVNDATDSMIEPHLGMLDGNTSYSKPKGGEDKEETKENGNAFAKTKENGKAFAIGVNKARN